MNVNEPAIARESVPTKQIASWVTTTSCAVEVS